jgi:hypothetical protein
MAGILSCKGYICRSWCSSPSAYPSCNPLLGQYDAYISQAAKDARKGQDTLVNVFDRIEGFFRRLEIYAEVRPTTQMMDTIIQIMVEILSILGIATKEIKEGRLSEQFSTSISSLTEANSEKYGKRLIGRTDMEDALQRLDKLTQEEARMAAVENLKATHTVDERVRGVANTVAAIDNSVAEIAHGARIIFSQF